ncbi:MAG TPA: hypothetical protein VJS40_00135 [Aestuariivirgaceae bacterium]|nr:hypothetical protein [Aestuariivirgaceae bacterium]
MTGGGRRDGEGDRRAGRPDGQTEPDDDNDWAVVWGKRLGRTIGFGLAIYLVWHLISTYGGP